MELNLFNVILQAGAFGLLAYLIVYGIPSWVKDFREERKADRTERDADRREREKERLEMDVEREEWITNFRLDRKLDRDAEDKRYQELTATFREEQKIERDACERRHQQILLDIKEGRQEVRHGLNNLANAVSLRNQANKMEAEVEKRQADDIRLERLRGGQ